MDSDLDKMEALLEQAAQGQVPGSPPPAQCQAQLNSMREWRGHYDVVAPCPDRKRMGNMLVRFAMPLTTTEETPCS